MYVGKRVLGLEVSDMSNVTKESFAAALKELMKEKAFEKITVVDICDKCGKNRKSFYYHFKDKYDLVNWIFDNEFIEVARHKNYGEMLEPLLDVCEYFYENKSFYRKALSINGQNSFSDHFRELMFSVIYEQLEGILQVEVIPEFQANFYTDAVVMAFQRWIMEYNNMLPADFLSQMAICIEYLVSKYGKAD